MNRFKLTLRPLLMGHIIPPRPLKSVCKAFKAVCKAPVLVGQTHPRTLSLANSGDRAFIAAANALDLDAEGWALIPYGDTLHGGQDGRGTQNVAGGVIQRFEMEDARAIVEKFNSMLGRIKRAVVGFPIYKGHPDAEHFAAQYPDKTEIGTVGDMRADTEGLRFRPVLTEAGAEYVEAGHGEFSPYWILSNLDGQTDPQGRPIYGKPVLKSIGIVRKGNMPDLSLVNHDNPNPKPSPKMDLLLRLLAALGRTVETDATDEQLNTHVDEAIAALPNADEPGEGEGNDDDAPTEAEVAELKEELATANAAVTAAKAKLDAAETKATKAEADRLAAVNSADADRKAHAKTLVDHAIASGRVPAAKAEEETLALANAEDFGIAAKALADREPELKTRRLSTDLGAKGNSQKELRGKMLALVNEAMPKHGNDYVKASAAVAATAEGKALTAEMEKFKPTQKA